MKRSSTPVKRSYPMDWKPTKNGTDKPKFKPYHINPCHNSILFTLAVFGGLLSITAIYSDQSIKAYYPALFNNLNMIIAVLTIGTLTGCLIGKVSENSWTDGFYLGLVTSLIVIVFTLSLV